MDGQRVLAGNESGKIFYFEGRTIGNKNILLATIRITEESIIGIGFLNYNGDFKGDSALVQTSDGIIKHIKII